MRWLYPALFVIGLVAYGAVACKRVSQQSGAPHFVFQADAWLHGKIAVDGKLPNDDWAQIETVALADGTEVKGRRMVTRPMFRTLAGAELPVREIRRSLGRTAYVSFPPFPAVVMLPSALLFGRAAGDVIPTLLIAAAILPLGLLLLRRLAEAKLSTRSVGDDLWLVAALAFGSVMLFSAVQGKVWFTAHVIGVALALLYAWASIEAKFPFVAGLAFGAAALTRTPMAFMLPLFVFEAWRMARITATIGLRGKLDRTLLRDDLVRVGLRFAVPVMVFAIAGMLYNHVRFASATEFGHTYLALGTGQPVRQQYVMEKFGLFDLHYLSRNLVVAFGLLPEQLPRAPWVQVSGHGLAIWVTSPVLLLLLVWPRAKHPLRLALWATVACVGIPSLLYMNSGWVQFGYRFSLDYLVFLIMLLAIGDRPLGILAKILIGVGIAVNLFGAITFDRMWKYYRYAGDAYDVVARNTDMRITIMAVVLVVTVGVTCFVRVRNRNRPTEE